MLMRPYQPADAPLVTDILRETQPAFVFTEAGVQHWIDAQPRRARLLMLVAEDCGRLVGCADAFLVHDSSVEGGSRIWVGVREEARNRGIGSRLYEEAEAHLSKAGAERVTALTDERPEGERFLRKRGFTEGRKERISALDPATADTSRFDELRANVAREGYGLVRLAEVLDKPYQLFECFAEAGGDAPADEPWDRARYEEWRRQSLERPDLTSEGSFVVVHEGKPVSLSWLEIDPETRRAGNYFTGTMRAHRQRGLGRLVKSATIRWAHERGIREIVTGNDLTNAPNTGAQRSIGLPPALPLARVHADPPNHGRIGHSRRARAPTPPGVAGIKPAANYREGDSRLARRPLVAAQALRAPKIATTRARCESSSAISLSSIRLSQSCVNVEHCDVAGAVVDEAAGDPAGSFHQTRDLFARCE
jgi:GNAT superfamily N-acetyltransferase